MDIETNQLISHLISMKIPERFPKASEPRKSITNLPLNEQVINSLSDRK